MIKAILLDFNGVIIDDEPLQMKAYQEIFKADAIDLSEEDYYSCMGMDDTSFIKEIYKRAGKDIAAAQIEEISAKKTSEWRKMLEKGIPSFEGVENFVRMAEKNFSLGIVSMAKKEEIEFALENLGIRDAFLTVVSSENVARCKPDPECYRKAFSMIDSARLADGRNPLTRKECLVIEDSPQGIMAGKGARMKTLGITNTVSADQLRSAGADVVSKTLSDWMPNSIQRLF